jgi:hypothetical protein
VCGTKNFASVRLYSAPQLHRTIVAILGICAYGTPKQVETRRHKQTDPLPAVARDCTASESSSAASRGCSTITGPSGWRDTVRPKMSE